MFLIKKRLRNNCTETPGSLIKKQIEQYEDQ